MADDQGLNGENYLPDGAFSRATTGRTIKRLLANVGADGRGFNQRDAPPDNPEVGDVYLTDGANWDPNAAASPQLVAYDTGGGWTAIATL